ncbi:MAG: DUF3352 domain-containing protein [Leptolyngbyaceae cyanobacterium bins.59]|nr:DUF3352 domain-containing protein [Leptolyngbyaceae cyanobacterium bins.59]
MPAAKTPFLIPAIAAAALVAGGVGAYLYFKGGVGESASPLSSAKIVPDEAIMTAYISTDEKAWSQLKKFGTPEAQALVEKSIKNFQTEMLTDTNFDIEKDLKPWMGGVMFAVLPPSNYKPSDTSAKASTPTMLMVIGIKDRGNALNFAQKLKSQKGATTKESNYKGVTVAEVTEKPGSLYNVAVLNDHLVVSDNRKAVETAIDTFKGEPSFAGREGVSNLLTQGTDLKNPLAQVYLPDYGAAIQQLAAASPDATPLPPATLNQLKQVKSMVVGLGVDDAGLRLKALAKLDPKIAAEFKPVPGKVVSQFPVETIGLMGGQGIKYTWNSVVAQSQNDPSIGLAVNLIKTQLQAVNLDADKEVFGWMDGEFALGLIASDKGMLASTGFGGALVVQTSDRATAEATLAKLDNLAKSNAVNVAQRDLQGKSVTEWKVSPTEALLGHGWLDQNTLFLAVGGPIVDVMANKPPATLDGSETYKTVTKSLPKEGVGYFYLDMDRVVALLNSPAFKSQTGTIPPETSAILNSIHGIGMSAVQSDKTTSQFEVLMALKPAK